MQWEAWFSLVLLVLVFAGLVANIAPDALLVAALVAVTVTGVVTPDQAFSGFANTGMLTVGALYIVAAGLRETGALTRVGAWVLGRARTDRGVLVRMALLLPAMSAFLNNTPLVSMFIPIITEWSRRHQVAASKLLLPLSYFCILGGTCTLIGTSTNLVVNGMMTEAVRSDASLGATLYPISLFEFAPVGVPYALVGCFFILTIGYRLLPSRRDFLDQLTTSAREYLVNLRVEPACGLVGRAVEEAGLRHLTGLFLIEINRGDRVISPVRPDQVLQAGDVLTFTGVITNIVDLEKVPGLVPVADDAYETRITQRRGRELCEAVVSGASPFLGKTIRDADFRAAYNAAIVAVHRGGERLEGRVGDIVLRPGDTLLLQAGPHFVRANRNNPDFLLVGGVEDSRPVRNEKALLSVVLLGALVVLMTSGVMEVVTAAFLIAGLLVATRCLSIANARQSVDWQTLITIAAAFGLGKALVQSGLVAVIASAMVSNMGQWGPYALLAGVYLMTSGFTEVVTNNAAAALMFPFAVRIAVEAGVSPRPFVMAIAFAASASFVTPLGYQTNLMVFGPGGYRLSDFVRVGLPLNLILLACAVILIPLVWAF
jgi:di/tricarboxylate transporter